MRYTREQPEVCACVLSCRPCVDGWCGVHVQLGHDYGRCIAGRNGHAFCSRCISDYSRSSLCMHASAITFGGEVSELFRNSHQRAWNLKRVGANHSPYRILLGSRSDKVASLEFHHFIATSLVSSQFNASEAGAGRAQKYP